MTKEASGKILRGRELATLRNWKIDITEREGRTKRYGPSHLSVFGVLRASKGTLGLAGTGVM